MGICLVNTNFLVHDPGERELCQGLNLTARESVIYFLSESPGRGGVEGITSAMRWSVEG